MAKLAADRPEARHRQSSVYRAMRERKIKCIVGVGPA